MPRVASAIVIRPVVGAEVLLADAACLVAVDASRRCRASPARTTSPGATCCGKPKANTDRMPVSWRPLTAASAWSGVFMMCDQSTSVVMPALMHSIAPQRLAA